jgi:hypothetical protein
MIESLNRSSGQPAADVGIRDWLRPVRAVSRRRGGRGRGLQHVVGDVDVVVNVRWQDLTELENLVDRMRAAGGATGNSVPLILRPATLSVRDYAGEVERRSGAAATAKTRRERSAGVGFG